MSFTVYRSEVQQVAVVAEGYPETICVHATMWANSEGMDICINPGSSLSLTLGESMALFRVLAELLREDEDEDEE